MLRRVLVVEDDQWIAQSLLIALRTLPAVQIDLATDGEQALITWKASKYDLLLTDHHMREVSGMDVVRHLRQAGYSQPMLMVTAYDSLTLQREALDAGVTELISKPFSIEYLLQRAMELLPAP